MGFAYKKLYINGALVDASAGNTFEVICPGNGEQVATVAWASKEDTLKALSAAQTGFESWSQLPLHERLDWMNKLRARIIERKEFLRTSIMYEMGKVWEGTAEDLDSIINSLEFYAQEMDRLEDITIKDKEGTHDHRIISQPLGVVVAFLAYNFPLLNLGFKLGPALAAGCSIILKPSEYSPLSAYLIGEICEEIGFPKGVINVLCGDIENVGIPLCESTIPQLITMIGSTQTAQKLIAQSSKTSIKRYSMECGGNAPFIVFNDADLEQAIAHGAALKIGNSGQICVAPNRFYVHEEVIEAFLSGLIEKFQAARIGFGREEAPELGPLTNQRSLDHVLELIKSAIEQGGKLLYGGKKIDRPGFFLQPTVIRIDDKDAPILQEEIFGPVAMVVPFTHREEVLSMANDTDAGLASYVYSSDQDTLDYFAKHLMFGEVQLNGFKYDIYLPHGGIKNSGFGVDCSEFALDDYLIKKRVTLARQTS